jgi:VWFA-related protein
MNRMPKAVSLLVALPLAAVPLVAWAQPPQEPPTFHSGTRLVEVEVVVRDQPVRPPGVGAWFSWVLDSGPPFGPPGIMHAGLTKDDFLLLDQGRPQQIAVFHTASSGTAPSASNPLPIPPKAISNRPVSNRQSATGRPVESATAVLIDFLNTDFGCLGYERIGMTILLRSLAKPDGRIALYTLGENLHVLHDFTDDPQKLADLAAQLEQPHSQKPAALASAIKDYGDLMDLGRDQIHGQMTVKALRPIIQHLSGVPGRKNLVWLMYEPQIPPAVMAFAQQANIVIYPVLVRLVGHPDPNDLSCGGAESRRSHAAEALAAVTGGRAFFDSLDLTSAVRTTQEDATTAYILGYYPAEETLDGKYHQITVKLRDKSLEKENLEIHYRSGYLATKVALPAPTPTPQELFEGPVDATGIGLSAQASPDPQHPGLYDVSVTVDLHDIHLESNAGHFTGSFELSIPNPSAQHTVRTATVPINLTEQQFAEALEHGLTGSVNAVEPSSGEIRVVVRDPSTGAAGSVRIPVTSVH